MTHPSPVDLARRAAYESTPSDRQVQDAVAAWAAADRRHAQLRTAADNARLRAAALKRAAQDLIDRQDLAAGRTPTEWPDRAEQEQPA